MREEWSTGPKPSAGPSGEGAAVAEGLGPGEVAKEIAEHNKHAGSAAARPPAGTGSSRSSRLRCWPWWRCSRPGRASRRPSGAPSRACSWPRPTPPAPSPTGPTGDADGGPELRLVHVLRLVHRLHPRQPGSDDDRRATVPARVQGGLRRLAGDEPSDQPQRRPRGRPTCPSTSNPSGSEADELDAKADEKYAEGAEAGETADQYVRITVFLATVLFLVGHQRPLPGAGRSLRADRGGGRDPQWWRS